MCPVTPSSNSGSWGTIGKVLSLPVLPTIKALELLVDGVKMADKENHAIAIGLRAPLAVFGCSTEGGKQCWDPITEGDAAALEGETKYQSGDFAVIMPLGIDPGVAQYYLSQMQSCQSFVKDIFTLETPIAKINLIMRSGTDCKKIACTRNKTITMPLNADGSDIAFFNDAFLQGAFQLSATCDDNTVAHEMSHALRSGVAAFHYTKNVSDFPQTGTTLEEGLSMYTEVKVDEARYQSSTSYFDLIPDAGGPPQPLSTMILIPETGIPIRINYVRFDADGVEIEYRVGNDTPASTFLSFSEGCVLEGYAPYGLGLRASTMEGSDGQIRVALKVYDLSTRDAMMMQYFEPTDTGYSLIKRYKTADGDIVDRNQPIIPYGDIDLTDGQGPYVMGQLFWISVRKKYGEETISRLLAAVAATHKERTSNFSFLDIFVQVTGVDRTEARAFFTKFSISPDATFYDLQLCWR